MLEGFLYISVGFLYVSAGFLYIYPGFLYISAGCLCTEGCLSRSKLETAGWYAQLNTIYDGLLIKACLFVCRMFKDVCWA